MTELIVSGLSSFHEKAEVVDSNITEISWNEYFILNVGLKIPIEKADIINVSELISWGQHELLDVSDSLIHRDNFNKLTVPVLGIRSGTHPVDRPDTFVFEMVDLTGSKLDPNREFRYLPTSDFQITSELIGFTSDFIEPIDLTLIRSRLSPVDTGETYPWVKTTIKDVYQEIKWGYSLNNFLVGGSTRTDYPVDEDAINPPLDPPPVAGVIRIVNTVNVVKLPERTAIDFVDFTLATDLNSIAWAVNFTIGSQASLDLLKPVGLTTVEIEININGELFVCFIGRTKTQFSTDSNGMVIKNYKCTGWSATKQLSYPYSTKRSHTETSSSTPSGLLNDELLGTGFIGAWSSVSWTIPANVFSYYEKSPLAAITELSESVGAVIIPDPETKTLTVKPYYPVSPWDWGTASVDFNLSETEFYTMDTEWLPKESPDSIYIYGEETSGVAVKAVKLGTAGLITLPTIVNKYITDNVAGGERGRIEIAKNAFKEIIPVTTYVDPNDGIIKPQSLLQITPLSGTTWRGMVIATSISIKRVGTAVVQALQIERHYD